MIQIQIQFIHRKATTGTWAVTDICMNRQNNVAEETWHMDTGSRELADICNVNLDNRWVVYIVHDLTVLRACAWYFITVELFRQAKLSKMIKI